MLASYRTYKKENSRSILLICSNNQFNSIQFQHLLFLLGAFFSIDQTFFETNENFLNPTSLSGDKAETATTRRYSTTVLPSALTVVGSIRALSLTACPRSY